ncbi:hypothetical protein [Algoriphagus sp. A40]|uniref:hypothetical protein n=1 Tax=Algoriphagus sp. A40 TaxID=1945863 RepID=UPI000986F0F0|nr:hypothetical protein [Algoriphagus sp. A40]OOG73349.1 hypothetical protein B0E43_13540 [Algoriphagus sp. A40]
MTNLQELINQEIRLKPHLRPNDYSFIGPEDTGLLNGFIQNVNFFAPSNIFSTTYKEALTNQDAILMALAQFQENTPLRIYVVLGKMEERGVLIHSTIQEYCDRFKIDFE